MHIVVSALFDVNNKRLFLRFPNVQISILGSWDGGIYNWNLVLSIISICIGKNDVVMRKGNRLSL